MYERNDIVTPNVDITDKTSDPEVIVEPGEPGVVSNIQENMERTVGGEDAEKSYLVNFGEHVTYVPEDQLNRHSMDRLQKGDPVHVDSESSRDQFARWKTHQGYMAHLDDDITVPLSRVRPAPSAKPSGADGAMSPEEIMDEMLDEASSTKDEIQPMTRDQKEALRSYGARPRPIKSLWMTLDTPDEELMLHKRVVQGVHRMGDQVRIYSTLQDHDLVLTYHSPEAAAEAMSELRAQMTR